MQTLSRQLDAFLAGVLERTDPATAEILREAARSGLPGTADIRVAGPRAGDPAPDFALADQRGARIGLRELLAKGPLVLTFFRGGWCPFCTISLRALDSVRAELAREGATVAAISPQRSDLALDTAERNDLKFPLLIDPGSEVARRYGLVWELGPELRTVYERLGHALPQVNAAREWALPIPAGFVIAQDGTIAYAHVDPRITRRLEPREAVRAVKDLCTKVPGSA